MIQGSGGETGRREGLKIPWAKAHAGSIPAPSIDTSPGVPSPTPATPPRSTDKFRKDIEGLRAIAILTVVAFHAGIPGFGGGFVGVDIFFVLSGYLITGLLVREHSVAGRISITRFYARRARRLLPAAALVGITSMVLAAFIYSPLEQMPFTSSAAAAAAYVSNLWFATKGLDYLNPYSEFDPFLHTWSLAAEEQFYLLWPLLIGVVAYGGLKRSRLIFSLGAVCLVSFAVSLWLMSVAQPWAFFGSPARAWEFAFGGAVWLMRAPAPHWRRLGTLLAVAGIGGILAAATGFDRYTPFPGTAVLLPVVGTGMLLYAGQHFSGSRPLELLALSPMQFVGRLSYSWYLWHWPILLFAVAVFGELALGSRVLAMVVALVLALLSHVLLERPVRYSKYLASRPVTTILGAAAVIVIGLCAAGLWRSAVIKGLADPEQRPFAAARAGARVYEDGCHLSLFQTVSPTCAYGDTASATQIILFGDSHAAHWFPALQEVSRRKGWRLASLSKSSCPSADVYAYAESLKRVYHECLAWREGTIERIIRERPAAVVLSNASFYGDTAATGRAALVGREAWNRGLAKTVARFVDSGLKVVLLVDPPRPGVDIPVCLSRAAWRNQRPDACTISREKALRGHIRTDEAAFARRTSGVSAVDVTDVLCDVSRCPPVARGTIVYRDTNHLSVAYSRMLADELQRPLEAVVSGASRLSSREP